MRRHKSRINNLPTARLQLEACEDRAVPAGFSVHLPELDVGPLLHHVSDLDTLSDKVTAVAGVLGEIRFEFGNVLEGSLGELPPPLEDVGDGLSATDVGPISVGSGPGVMTTGDALAPPLGSGFGSWPTWTESAAGRWGDLLSDAAPPMSGGIEQSVSSTGHGVIVVPKPPDAESGPVRPGTVPGSQPGCPRTGLIVIESPRPSAPSTGSSTVARTPAVVRPEGLPAAPSKSSIAETGAADAPVVISDAAIVAEPAVDSVTLPETAREILNWALPGIDAADLVTRFAPEVSALGEAVDSFLDRLSANGEGAVAWLSSRHIGLAGVTIAAGLGAGELARRKKLPQRLTRYLSRSLQR